MPQPNNGRITFILLFLHLIYLQMSQIYCIMLTEKTVYSNKKYIRQTSMSKKRKHSFKNCWFLFSHCHALTTWRDTHKEGIIVQIRTIPYKMAWVGGWKSILPSSTDNSFLMTFSSSRHFDGPHQNSHPYPSPEHSSSSGTSLFEFWKTFDSPRMTF